MAIQFGKYLDPKRAPNAAAAKAAAAQSFHQLGAGIRENRRIAAQRAYQADLTRQEDERIAARALENDARRGHDIHMQERAEARADLEYERAVESERQQKGNELVAKAQMARQAGDMPSFAAYVGVLEGMGFTAEEVGDLQPPVEESPHTMAGRELMGGVLPPPPAQPGGMAQQAMPNMPFLAPPPPAANDQLPSLAPATPPAAPQQPQLRVIDNVTGKERLIGMEGQGLYEHPEDEMSALISNLVPETQKQYWDAAVPIVRSYMGDATLPEQLKEVGRLAGEMSTRDLAERRFMASERRKSSGGGGQRKGKGLTANEKMRAMEIQSKEVKEVLDKNGYFKDRQAISDLSASMKLLSVEDENGNVSYQNVEGAATAIASSIQAGVLSNQDKKPWVQLMGVHGNLKTWWAKNIEDGKAPRDLVIQLKATINEMVEAKRAKIGQTYSSVEADYRSLDTRHRDAVMRGEDPQLTEILRMRMGEMEHDIRASFHKNHWKNLFDDDGGESQAAPTESKTSYSAKDFDLE